MFIEGTIDSYEAANGPVVHELYGPSRKKKEISSFYFVATDQQKYFFLLDDCPIDRENPENAGLHLLLVVRAEDEDMIWDGSNRIIYDGDEKLLHSGIYLPLE